MILVTGSAGIVGSAFMEFLISKGVNTIGMNRDQFDLSQGTPLVRFIQKRPDVIIHLAAAVPHSVRYPDSESSAIKTNSIDKVIFNAAKEWGCRIIYASTCSLYDKTVQSVKFEDSPISDSLQSPYMKAKYDGEQMFSSLPSYSILRLPAPIGPNLPDTVVAKRFLYDALITKKISVWGTGKRQQNYVDVLDIANAFYKTAFSSCCGIFNISAEKPITMLELAKSFVSVIPQSSYQTNDVHDPLEFECTDYSNTKAKKTLNWSPSISLIESIRTMLKKLK
jgi:nucleoside-diphosphate-sugar epimerase